MSNRTGLIYNLLHHNLCLHYMLIMLVLNDRKYLPELQAVLLYLHI